MQQLRIGQDRSAASDVVAPTSHSSLLWEILLCFVLALRDLVVDVHSTTGRCIFDVQSCTSPSLISAEANLTLVPS